MRSDNKGPGPNDQNQILIPVSKREILKRKESFLRNYFMIGF
jgi:hypothetical protein